MKLGIRFQINLLTFLCIIGPSVFAQLPGVQPENVTFKITELEIKKVRLRELSPRVEGFAPDNKSEWYRIKAEYTVGSGHKKAGGYRRDVSWVDSCVFSWRVILALTADERKKGVSEKNSLLLERDIRYANIDIDPTKTKSAVVYIEPSFSDRFKSNLIDDGVLVELTISTAGKAKARAWARGGNFYSGTSLPARLFPKSEEGLWFKSKSLNRVDYGLLSRHETPWAWSSYEAFEFIVNDRKN